MTFPSLAAIAQRESARTLRSLPPQIRKALEGVPVVFEPSPGDPSLDPDLLGLYDPGPDSAPAPKIILWLDNLWDYSSQNVKIFREEVRQTLLHEIGHHIGWDEDDLENRGL